jgi:hypothetical protein
LERKSLGDRGFGLSNVAHTAGGESKSPWWKVLIFAAATAFAAAVGTGIYQWLVGRAEPAVPITATMAASYPDCEVHVIDSALLNSLPSRDRFDAKWVHDHDGASYYRSALSIIVQGRSDAAVVLTGLEVVDVERIPVPQSAVGVSKCELGLGGQLGVRYFRINFNGSRPTIEAVPSDQADAEGNIEPAVDFPYKVSSSEPEVFYVLAYGPDCVCEWDMNLHWSSEGKAGTVKLLRDGAKIRKVFDDDIPLYEWHEDGRLEQHS